MVDDHGELARFVYTHHALGFIDLAPKRRRLALQGDPLVTQSTAIAPVRSIAPVATTHVAPIAERASALMLSPVQWEALVKQCDVLWSSQVLPDHIKNGKVAAAVALYGIELGISMWRAWQGTYVSKGQISLRANLARSLCFERAPGATIQLLKRDETQAIWRMGRPGEKPFDFSFTMSDAQRGGLLEQRNRDGDVVPAAQWKQRPRNMLAARAFTDGAWATFPDVLQGASIAHLVGGTENEGYAIFQQPQPQEPSEMEPLADVVEEGEVCEPVEQGDVAEPPRTDEIQWASSRVELEESDERIRILKDAIQELSWAMAQRAGRATKEGHEHFRKMLADDLKTTHMGRGWEGHRPTAEEADKMIEDLVARGKAYSK